MQDLHSTDPTHEACATVLRADHKGPSRHHELLILIPIVLILIVLIFCRAFCRHTGVYFHQNFADKAPSGKAEVGVGVRLGFRVDIKSMSSPVP